MKKYIRSDNIVRVELDICAVLALSMTNTNVAAAKKDLIQQRDLPFEYQLTDKQFEAYKNFIRSAVSVIKKRGFYVDEEYQSNKSYSYYIRFTPTPYIGFEDKMLELDVKFRLSDHYQQSDSIDTEGEESDDTASSDTSISGTIFQSFVVEGVTHDNIAATLLDIKTICEDLQVGDYSRLM